MTMALVLQPMTATDFAAWSEQSVAGYAAEKVCSGEWTAATALDLARESFAKILPQGFNTADHYFYLVIDEANGHRCGHLWFARQGESAYLYDIAIAAEFRGKGHGRATMRLFESAASKLGLRSLRLHVFGHNRVARSLYESLGYETTDLWMRKQLSSAQ